MGERTLTLRHSPKSLPASLQPSTLATTITIDEQIGRCYVLIGVAGSGKTTWRNTVIDRWRKRAKPVVISEDDLIEDECLRSGQTWGDVLARCDHAEQKKMMMEQFHAAIGVGRDIIIDRPNLTAEDRSELLLLLPDSYQKIGILFTIPNNHLFHRLEQRQDDTGRPFSATVVQNMIKRLERPWGYEFDRLTFIDHTCTYD